MSVSCDLYDRYEYFSLRKTIGVCTYSLADGSLVQAEAVYIGGLETRTGREYMHLSNGETIDLMQIISFTPIETPPANA